MKKSIRDKLMNARIDKNGNEWIKLKDGFYKVNEFLLKKISK